MFLTNESRSTPLPYKRLRIYLTLAITEAQVPPPAYFPFSAWAEAGRCRHIPRSDWEGDKLRRGKCHSATSDHAAAPAPPRKLPTLAHAAVAEHKAWGSPMPPAAACKELHVSPNSWGFDTSQRAQHQSAEDGCFTKLLK